MLIRVQLSRIQLSMMKNWLNDVDNENEKKKSSLPSRNINPFINLIFTSRVY